ncbi:glutathione synthetase [Streptomyces chryseus]
MSFATPVLSVAALPAHRIGTAALIAPSSAGDLYVAALARHGWASVAVTSPDAGPVGQAVGYVHKVVHTGSARRTATHLAGLGVQAVLVGSPQGAPLADRIASRLALPGNDPDTGAARSDIGLTSAALLEAGITAPRSIRTSSLTEALHWAAFSRLSVLVLQHPDPAHPDPGLLCHTSTDIQDAWSRLQRTNKQVLVLREHLSGAQYRIHTLTTPGRADSPDHTITAIWSQTHTPTHQVGRADLLSRQGLLARALALYTMRALTALGIRYGPAHADLAFIPDRGPALLSLRTDPYNDFASDVLRRATGHDPIRDTAQMLATGLHPHHPWPRRTHVTKVALLPQHDGALDSTLLRTITTLPTVAATTPLTAGTAVTAGRAAGWLLLVADDRRTINQDYRVIRAVENLGLYRSTR